MPKHETTEAQARTGTTGKTGEKTVIKVAQPAIEILIGGPYKDRYGDVHSYGHAALRTISDKEDRVYDFGRYGKTTGEFGAEGEGILRVWTNFNSYIAGENSYGRITTGYLYSVTKDQVDAINSHFSNLVANAETRKSKHPHQNEYKLRANYHGVTNNCATMTLNGAKIALPEIESGSSAFNIGRGMSSSEKFAARARGFGAWPSRIFMPPDVQAMLEANTSHKPSRTTIYGTKK